MREVVIAEGPRRYFFLQHEIDHIFVGTGEDVADLGGRDLGFVARLLRYGKAFPEQKKLGQKIAGRRARIFEGDDFAAQIFEPRNAAFLVN